MTNLLIIDQGDDEKIDIACKTAEGTPLPLSSTKLWFFVKKSKADADADAIIHKTTDPSEGVEVTDSPGGIAEVTINPEDTASLASTLLGRTLLWQLQAKNGLGEIITLAKGEFLINRDLITSSS